MAGARAFPQVRTLRDREAFLARAAALGLDLPVSATVEPDGPLARPLTVGSRTIGNRWCVLPMEGWDAGPDGAPTDLVRRRWRRFGESGAKLVWGGEAVAVRPDGRANAHQLLLDAHTADALGTLRRELVDAHAAAHGQTDDLVVGLQLTHSGRFARPAGVPAPRAAYRHPFLDERVGIDDDRALLSDAELDDLVDSFVVAAERAAHAGFDFVDVKHCHGYLGHELLSATDRPGRYGGDLDGRTRFLRGVLDGIAAAVPGLGVALRLSVFDLAPYVPGPGGVGVPAPTGGYRHAFGGDGTGSGIDLREPLGVLDRAAAAGVALVCVTGGSPYYNPHCQRPAYFPPSDGYLPPEDPLIGVARLLGAARAIKAARPGLTVVASGLSYLQEWVGHVAQALVADGWCDAVGLGRMALSYPTLPADVLAGRPLERRRLCRTFSDCTTAPRHGLVSGCYPLDGFYKDRPERVELAAAKRAATRRLVGDDAGDAGDAAP